jgi:pimeloyl-ACP methyl ester carboxylesterase
MNCLRFLGAVVFIPLYCPSYLGGVAGQPESYALYAQQVVDLAPMPPKQISYAYKTEVVLGSTMGRELPQEIESYAKKIYKNLNDSPYFKTSFVRNVSAVRVHHIDPNNPDRGQLLLVNTEDGLEIRCTYFDRGSDELVVVGSGFTSKREMMTPFVEMFKTDATGVNKGRDVILFDFRGHGYDPVDLCDSSTWMAADLARNTFGIDARYSMLGEVEEFDVVAVIKAMRAYKNYKKVHGVSVCFGSFVFLKAEAKFPGLFDRIVVDGCWDTLDKVINKLKQDFMLLTKPQTGFWKEYWLSKQEWFQQLLIWIARHVLSINIDHDIHLTDYLPRIEKTPILFFYGKNDLLVYRDEFEDLWNALSVPYKIAVVTNNPHVMNHYKQKELYKLVCEAFFASSNPEEFGKQFFQASLHTLTLF